MNRKNCSRQYLASDKISSIQINLTNLINSFCVESKPVLMLRISMFASKRCNPTHFNIRAFFLCIFTKMEGSSCISMIKVLKVFKRGDNLNYSEKQYEDSRNMFQDDIDIAREQRTPFALGEIKYAFH